MCVCISDPVENTHLLKILILFLLPTSYRQILLKTHFKVNNDNNGKTNTPALKSFNT